MTVKKKKTQLNLLSSEFAKNKNKKQNLFFRPPQLRK